MAEKLDILLKECKRGKSRSQEELYRRFASAMYGLCLQYASNEEDAQDIDTLKKFLTEKGHPIVERWSTEEEEPAEDESVAETGAIGMPQVGLPAFDPAMLQNLPPMTGGGGGGIKVTLKNAKISIDKIILSNKE